MKGREGGEEKLMHGLPVLLDMIIGLEIRGHHTRFGHLQPLYTLGVEEETLLGECTRDVTV